MGWGTRRGTAENPLVSYAQEKIVMVEKIGPKDLNGDRGQLEQQIQAEGTKT